MISVMAAAILPVTSHVTAESGMHEKIDLERFILHETCIECHEQTGAQWENSMHNLAHEDPVYNSIAHTLRKGLKNAGEIKEAESCVKCHTPIGFVSGFPTKLSDNLSKTPEIATRGIQCDYCHCAVDITHMYNNGLVIEPGYGEDDPGTKHGPFDDCEPDYHEAEFSKMHTQSKICGTCHDVKHVVFGTPLETTYSEWEKSPYNTDDPKKRITCQGCHMFQRPGIPATGSTPRPANPGSITEDSSPRPHIFTHYFVGANTMVPSLKSDSEKVEMARQRLKHAASISIDTSKADKGKLIVKISNTGAGHSIPTGVADLRQVWLEVIVKNKKGRVEFSSGIPDKNNMLPKGTAVFRTVFADGNGNQVINIAKAKKIMEDTRIKAGQTVMREFSLGFVPGKGYSVSARLLYTGISQQVLNLTEKYKNKYMPAIEMAKASTGI